MSISPELIYKIARHKSIVDNNQVEYDFISGNMNSLKSYKYYVSKKTKKEEKKKIGTVAERLKLFDKPEEPKYTPIIIPAKRPPFIPAKRVDVAPAKRVDVAPAKRPEVAPAKRPEAEPTKRPLPDPSSESFSEKRKRMETLYSPGARPPSRIISTVVPKTKPDPGPEPKAEPRTFKKDSSGMWEAPPLG